MLFLSAGVVIHGMKDEQDMRRMGGLLRLMPLSYVAVLLGSLSLVGIPFTSGFYSKELIIEAGLVRSMNGDWIGTFAYMAGLVGVLCTTIYSVRLAKMVYLARANSNRVVMRDVMEGKMNMSVPLVVLGTLAILSGYAMKELVTSSEYWGNSIHLDSVNTVEGEFIGYKLVPWIIIVAGMWIGFSFKWNNRMELHTFLVKKWYIDKVYNELVNQGLLITAYRIMYKGIDKGIIELVGSRGFDKIMK